MIIYTHEQGTDEWRQARAGVITASDFRLRHKVNGLTAQQATYVAALKAGASEAAAMAQAGYKSKPSAEAVQRALAGLPVGEWGDESKNYAFRKAIERITLDALTEDFAGNWFTQRGQRLEPVARAMHEAMKGVIVDEVGFVATDDRKFGASADGWIGDDGGAEYKAFLDPAKLRSILLDNDTDLVMDQCQGNMAITGRKWWHFGLYCPALDVINKGLTIIQIDRDDDYIDAMWDDLLALDALVEDYRNRLLAGVKPADLFDDADAEPAKPTNAVTPDAVMADLF